MKRSVLKRWDLAVSLLFLAGAAIFGASAYQTGSPGALSALGLLFCIVSIILGRVKLRCPFCHHFLGFFAAGGSPFCPWCGDQLTGSDTDEM